MLLKFVNARRLLEEATTEIININNALQTANNKNKELLINNINLKQRLQDHEDKLNTVQDEAALIKSEISLLIKSNKEQQSDLVVKGLYIKSLVEIEKEYNKLLSQSKVFIESEKNVICNNLDENSNGVDCINDSDESLHLKNKSVKYCNEISKRRLLRSSNILKTDRSKCKNEFCSSCKDSVEFIMRCLTSNINFEAKTSDTEEILQHYRSTNLTFYIHLMTYVNDMEYIKNDLDCFKKKLNQIMETNNTVMQVEMNRAVNIHAKSSSKTRNSIRKSIKLLPLDLSPIFDSNSGSKSKLEDTNHFNKISDTHITLQNYPLNDIRRVKMVQNKIHCDSENDLEKDTHDSLTIKNKKTSKYGKRKTNENSFTSKNNECDGDDDYYITTSKIVNKKLATLKELQVMLVPLKSSCDDLLESSTEGRKNKETAINKCYESQNNVSYNALYNFNELGKQDSITVLSNDITIPKVSNQFEVENNSSIVGLENLSSVSKSVDKQSVQSAVINKVNNLSKEVVKIENSLYDGGDPKLEENIGTLKAESPAATTITQVQGSACTSSYYRAGFKRSLEYNDDNEIHVKRAKNSDSNIEESSESIQGKVIGEIECGNTAEVEDIYKTTVWRIFHSSVDTAASDIKKKIDSEMAPLKDWDMARLIDHILGFVTNDDSAGISRTHVMRVSVMMMVNIVIAERHQYKHYHQLLFTMIGECKSQLRLDLVSITVNILSSLRQYEAIVSFLVDLVTLPHVSVLLVPRCLTGTLAEIIAKKYGAFIRLLKLLIAYEYLTTDKDEDKLMVASLEHTTKMYWLSGDNIPGCDVDVVTHAIKATQEEYSLVESKINWSLLERIIRR